jgi:hypothetical protein
MEETMKRKGFLLIVFSLVMWALFPWLVCQAIGGGFSHNIAHHFNSPGSMNNTSYQDQLGDENESQILQNGTFNNGEGWGETYGASTIQVGNGNQADISQNGYNNCAKIHQEGNFNKASILQEESNNYASIKQIGNQNNADISQSGSDNFCIIEQYFSNNSMSVTQYGGNYAHYVQLGGGRCRCSIHQTAGALPVIVTQK